MGTESERGFPAEGKLTLGGARIGFSVFSHWCAILLVVVGAAGVLGLCCDGWGNAAW